MNLRKIITGLLTLLISFFVIPAVFAHGDEPRLEISVERVNPGGVVEVRGVDFEMEEIITLELVGPDVRISFGDFISDVEGVFSQIITLPADLKEGDYTFRTTTDDHVIESASLFVWGMPIMADEEDGQREEDDALLAPMPTFAPGVVPNDAVSQTKPPTPQPGSKSPVKASGNLMLAAYIALGLGILAILGLRMMRRQ